MGKMIPVVMLAGWVACSALLLAVDYERISHDVHYKRVLEWSLLNKPECSLAVMLEARMAEKHGEWRPETPLFLAIAWAYLGQYDKSKAEMERAKRLAPWAWWVVDRRTR